MDGVSRLFPLGVTCQLTAIRHFSNLVRPNQQPTRVGKLATCIDLLGELREVGCQYKADRGPRTGTHEEGHNSRCFHDIWKFLQIGHRNMAEGIVALLLTRLVSAASIRDRSQRVVLR